MASDVIVSFEDDDEAQEFVQAVEAGNGIMVPVPSARISGAYNVHKVHPELHGWYSDLIAIEGKEVKRG